MLNQQHWEVSFEKDQHQILKKSYLGSMSCQIMPRALVVVHYNIACRHHRTYTFVTYRINDGSLLQSVRWKNRNQRTQGCRSMHVIKVNIRVQRKFRKLCRLKVGAIGTKKFSIEAATYDFYESFTDFFSFTLALQKTLTLHFDR